MKYFSKNITTAYRLLCYLYGLAFIALFLDLASFFLLGGNVPGSLSVRFPLFGLLLITKLFFYSGTYGVLIDLVLGRETVFTFDLFKKNVGEAWAAYLSVVFAAFFIYTVAFVIGPLDGVSFESVLIYFDGLLCFLVALTITRKKFTCRTGKKGCFNFGSLALVIVVTLTSGLLVHILEHWSLGADFLYKALALASRYLHFFLFLVIVLFLQEFYASEIQDGEGPELFLIKPACRGMLESLAAYLSSMAVASYPSIFTILKVLTPARYRVREFNGVLWNDRYWQGNKLVAITAHTSNVCEAYKIAKGFKEKGSTVIMGGPHVSFMHDEALEFCDCVVIGEVQGVWKGIIRDYENGELKSKYFGLGGTDVGPEVKQALMGGEAEIAKSFIKTGSGCKFNCEFCATPAICGAKVKRTPVQDVVDLINKVKKRSRNILFLDDNIYADPKAFMEVFEAVRPLNVRWSASCSIDIARDHEALDLAKDSGCSMLWIGYEVSDRHPVQAQGGKFSLVKDYRRLTKRISKRGIRIGCHLIFGHERDGFRDMLDQVRFSLSNPFFVTSMSIMTPLPGADFYYRMLREDRMRSLNWASFDGSHFVFQHSRGRESFFEILQKLILFLIYFRMLTYLIFSLVVLLVVLFLVRS